METFHTNKGYNLSIVANFTIFEIEFFGTLFKRYLYENEAFDTSASYVNMNHFNIVFYMTWGKWQCF